jgi:hypothetical protein
LRWGRWRWWRAGETGFSEWQSLAAECGVDPEPLLDRDVVTTLASGLVQHSRQRRAGLVKAPWRRRRTR